MNPQRTKLLTAIKSAQLYVQSPSSGNSVEIQSTVADHPPKSKLAKLTGRGGIRKERKPLLSRVGIKSRPTFELIADGILGTNSKDYHPKVKLNNEQSNVSSLVAERIKDLRDRTLSKISSDTNIAEDSFFGFDPDGTCLLYTSPSPRDG